LAESFQQTHEFFRYSTYIVLAICGIVLTIGIIAWRSDGIASLGQLGDAFGMANTLFTGLAFAGVVYTLLLQQKQASAQQDQLHQQRQDSLRQAREQYFAARLNAQIALVQIEQLMNQPVTTSAQGEPLNHWHSERLSALMRLHVKLDLLAIESELAPNACPDLLPAENEAIRRYVFEPLGELISRWDRHGIDRGLEELTALKFSWLDEATGRDHPLVHSYLEQAIAQLNKLKENRAESEEWVRRNIVIAADPENDVWK
jgi:hypothetical protein